MENPIKMDDLGVPLFLETPKSTLNPSVVFHLVSMAHHLRFLCNSSMSSMLTRAGRWGQPYPQLSCAGYKKLAEPPFLSSPITAKYIYIYMPYIYIYHLLPMYLPKRFMDSWILNAKVIDIGAPDFLGWSGAVWHQYPATAWFLRSDAARLGMKPTHQNDWFSQPKMFCLETSNSSLKSCIANTIDSPPIIFLQIDSYRVLRDNISADNMADLFGVLDVDGGDQKMWPNHVIC